jgi:hypothetical protein
MTTEQIKKLDKAIWDELGGYEVSHPWMQGATDAVKARVLIIFAEVTEQMQGELMKDKERLDWIDNNYHRPEMFIDMAGESDVRKFLDAAMSTREENK